MKKHLVRPLAFTFAMAPAVAGAFQTVDTIQFPSTGNYPAYPLEQPAPTNWWIQGGVMRDSNVARLSTNANAQAILGTTTRSDTVSRLGAGIRHESRVYGRQTIRLEARGDEYHYSRFKAFDHFAYGALAEWRWELGNELSGTLGYNRRRVLIDLGEVQALQKDLITEQHLYGTAAYRFAADWRVRGGFDRAEVARASAVTSGQTNTVTGGIDYVSPLGNSIGIEARRSQGDFNAPEIVGVVPISNRFNEKEIAALGTYIAGPTLSVNGRLGRTQRDHTVLGQRDFNGTTWNYAMRWLPANKTALDLTAYNQVRSIVDAAASYVRLRGVQFGPSWAPTQKLVFSARWLRERREYLGDPLVAVAGAIARDETLRGIRFGVGWEVQRHFEISVGADRGTRSSNILNRDYEYTAWMLNGRVAF